jgi:hypothetical protein
MIMPRTRKNHANYEKVRKMRADGKKFQEIADELGISRQRAWEIHSRVLAASGPKKASRSVMHVRHVMPDTRTA